MYRKAEIHSHQASGCPENILQNLCADQGQREGLDASRPRTSRMGRWHVGAWHIHRERLPSKGYLDEMAIFLWDEFEVLVTTWSSRRALKHEGWSKKASRQKARERNANLRDAYFLFIYKLEILDGFGT